MLLVAGLGLLRDGVLDVEVEYWSVGVLVFKSSCALALGRSGVFKKKEQAAL